MHLLSGYPPLLDRRPLPDAAETWQTVHAEGELAELLQHEIDHLDGILALDRLTDLRTICVREEFEQRFRCASPYAQSTTG